MNDDVLEGEILKMIYDESWRRKGWRRNIRKVEGEKAEDEKQGKL